MPRLFVAVDLPDRTICELIRIQPRPADGIRLTRREQIHVTLHFLGEADVQQVCTALQEIRLPTFLLTL